MLIFMYLAAASTHPSGPSIDTFYYVLASISLIGGVVTAVWRYFVKQRKKWIDEGALRASQQQAIMDNNVKIQKNTEAVANLSARMDDFIREIRAELTTVASKVNMNGDRISRLEDFRHFRSRSYAEQQRKEEN